MYIDCFVVKTVRAIVDGIHYTVPKHICLALLVLSVAFCKKKCHVVRWIQSSRCTQDKPVIFFICTPVMLFEWMTATITLHLLPGSVRVTAAGKSTHNGVMYVMRLKTNSSVVLPPSKLWTLLFPAPPRSTTCKMSLSYVSQVLKTRSAELM